MNHPHESQAVAMARVGELPDGEQLPVEVNIGMKIEGWYCDGMPTDPLTPEQRAEIIDYARTFEECSYRRDEMTDMDDDGIVAVAYSAMADYARGQM